MKNVFKSVKQINDDFGKQRKISWNWELKNGKTNYSYGEVVTYH